MHKQVSCHRCGDMFETSNSRRKYCDECRDTIHYEYHTINRLRGNFLELCHHDIKKAEALVKEMKAEEGEEFTEMALDGIIDLVRSGASDNEKTKDIMEDMKLDRHKQVEKRLSHKLSKSCKYGDHEKCSLSDCPCHCHYR